MPAVEKAYFLWKCLYEFALQCAVRPSIAWIVNHYCSMSANVYKTANPVYTARQYVDCQYGGVHSQKVLLG